MAKFWDLIKHLPLPAVVLGLSGTAELIRIMRANLLDELRKPYVVTARAKGLSKWEGDSQVSGQGGAPIPSPARSANLFPYVVSGSIIVSVVPQPADGWPLASAVAVVPGYVPGRPRSF